MRLMKLTKLKTLLHIVGVILSERLFRAGDGRAGPAFLAQSNEVPVAMLARAEIPRATCLTRELQV